MESKRRGLFTKSKLVKSLYNRNGKRNKLEPPEKMNKELVMVKQQQKVAYVVPDRGGRLENFQGSLGAEDEAAAIYISNVQQRFRLEEMQQLL